LIDAFVPVGVHRRAAVLGHEHEVALVRAERAVSTVTNCDAVVAAIAG